MAARPATRAATAKIPQVAWDAARPAPIVLVSGPEELLADRAIAPHPGDAHRRDPSLEVTDLDASAAVTGDLTTLASPSLFGEPRLIRVTAVERLSEAFLNEALRYLEAPADGATVVLRHGGGVRGKKLLDAIRGRRGRAASRSPAPR